MPLKHLATAFVVMTTGAAVCGAQTKPDSAPATPVAKDAPAADAKAKPAHKNRDVITADEFERPELKTLTVLEAIKRLRPSFLNKRGGSSFGSMGDADAGLPRASIDWRALTGLDDLASMTLDNVKEIRFLDPGKATQRFGSGAGSMPVIVVITMN